MAYGLDTDSFLKCFIRMTSRRGYPQEIVSVSAESKSDIYFLQYENLLREKVVIRATNNLNLQWQHCCATICTKMLPILLGLKVI